MSYTRSINTVGVTSLLESPRPLAATVATEQNLIKIPALSFRYKHFQPLGLDVTTALTGKVDLNAPDEIIDPINWSHGRAAIHKFFGLLCRSVVTEVADRQLEPVITGMAEMLANFEGDWVTPSDFAYRSSSRIVADAYTLLRLTRPAAYEVVPVPLVSTDDLGGVRISWRTANKLLRANFGARPESRSYLYFETGDLHGIELLDRETLYERLHWLVV